MLPESPLWSPERYDRADSKAGAAGQSRLRTLWTNLHGRTSSRQRPMRRQSSSVLTCCYQSIGASIQRVAQPADRWSLSQETGSKPI